MLRTTVLPILWVGIVACLFAPLVSAQTSSRTATASESAETERRVGYLLADKVYRKPDAFAEEVTSVTRSDQVRIAPLPNMEGWYEVYRVGETEHTGYAFRPYISRFGPQGLASPPAAAEEEVSGELLREVVFAPMPMDVGATRVVRMWANVRVGPGMDHEAFGVIRPDAPFQVLAIERGWGRIKLEGAPGVGYVSAALLHTPSPSEVASVEPAERQTVVGSGVAGGGVTEEAEAEEPEESQADLIREALVGSGVDTEATVYVTRTGRKFHREDCRHLRSRTFAIPLAEAMLDYSPCRSCEPLQPVDGPEQPEEAPTPDRPDTAPESGE